MNLRISEIFTSVQGEGLWIGTPSTFVRVSGCNLRCVWCDTPYASWAPEGPVRSVEDVAEEVIGLGVRHVVLTGGEPMIFDGVADLAQRLKGAGHVLTIETAGTVLRKVEADLMSVSPKLGNSAPEGRWRETHEARRTNIEVLRALMDWPEYQFKFVVARETLESDVAEIEGLLAQVGGVEPGRVLLMPEGREVARLEETMQALVPVVMGRGWRVTPRLQIHLFGDTRGT